MQIRFDGSTYDVHALMKRFARGLDTIPGGRKMTIAEKKQLLDKARELGWQGHLEKNGSLWENTRFHGMVMVPGSHYESGRSVPSTHNKNSDSDATTGSGTSIGVAGWKSRGYSTDGAKRMQRRERRVRRMNTPSKETVYSKRYYTGGHSNSNNSINNFEEQVQSTYPKSKYPYHLSDFGVERWELKKADHLQSKNRRERVHTRMIQKERDGRQRVVQELQNRYPQMMAQKKRLRNAHEQVMLELRHAPPQTHHPGFPGGSNYHASKRRWNEMHESTSKKPRY